MNLQKHLNLARHRYAAKNSARNFPVFASESSGRDRASGRRVVGAIVCVEVGSCERHHPNSDPNAESKEEAWTRHSAWRWLAAAVFVHLVVSIVHGVVRSEAIVPLSRAASLFVFGCVSLCACRPGSCIAGGGRFSRLARRCSRRLKAQLIQRRVTGRGPERVAVVQTAVGNDLTNGADITDVL